MIPTSIDGTDITGATIDGTDVQEITVDGDVVFSGIPDTQVYLHDDWGDGKLQNRDGGGTTTHNGVTGYYRPEWQILNGSPSVQNGDLVLDVGDEIYTDLNLNFNQTIVWDATGFEISGQDATLGMTLFTDSLTHTGGWGAYSDGYTAGYRSDNVRVLRVNTGSSTNSLDSLSPVSNTADWTVTRQPNGDFTLSCDGQTLTVNDTTHTTTKYLVIGGRGSKTATVRYSELKVS